MLKLIIFPALFIPNEELEYSLRSVDKGSVLLICKRDFIEDYRYKGHFVEDDFNDIGSLIRKIEGWFAEKGKKPSGIIGIDDEDQFMVTRRIADRFSLDFYPDCVLQAASNKYIMKKRFKGAGVASPDFCLVRKPEDNIIGFPNVIKPICGSGSEFIFRNDDKEGLKKNLSILKKEAACIKGDSRFTELKDKEERFDSRTDFLVEGYAKGEEYSCDFSFSEGKITVQRVTKKYKSRHFGLFRGYFLMSMDTIKKQGISIELLKDTCKNIAASLKIEEGVCMVDFKADNGRIQVIETSIRPGFAPFINLMHRLYGYSSIKVLVEQKEGKAEDYSIQEEEGLVVQIIAPKEGKIKRLGFKDKEKLRSMGLLDCFLYNEPGDRIRYNKFDPNEMLLGYAAFKAQYHDLEKIFKAADDGIAMEMEDG